MTARRPSRIGVQDARGYDIRTEQQRQPVHRTHELRGGCAPAHTFRDRQLIERALHDAWQQAWRRKTWPGTGEEKEFALAFSDACERAHSSSAFFSELRGGRRGLALLVEGGAHRRTLELDGLGRL